MKYVLLGMLAALLVTTSVPQANAVVCASGVHRAGCVGPHGAVVAPRSHAAVCASGVYRAAAPDQTAASSSRSPTLIIATGMPACGSVDKTCHLLITSEPGSGVAADRLAPPGKHEVG
jgi:hypothetical protein